MSKDSPFSLEGKLIIVTGASSGIGKEIAIVCSDMGADVIILGRDSERLEETRRSLKTGNHLSVSVDLTDFENISSLVAQIHNRVGMIDGLVNCAGISGSFSINSTSNRRIEEFFSTNVYAAITLTREVIKRRHFNPLGGSIVFISSVMGIVGAKGKTLYSMTKGALVSGVKSMACELAERKIRINSICPGTIITPINQNLPHIADEESRKRLELMHPLGFGSTYDVACGAVYLLSDASKWITGQNLIIDGGYSIQ